MYNESTSGKSNDDSHYKNAEREAILFLVIQYFQSVNVLLALLYA